MEEFTACSSLLFQYSVKKSAIDCNDGAIIIKLLFKQKSTPIVRLLICIALAMGLMIMSQRLPAFQQVRRYLDIVVLPIQYIVNWPIQIVHSTAMRLTTQQKLLEDNAKLRARQLLLQAKLQKLLVLERENAQLRELLKSTEHLGGHVLVGQILAVSLDPALHQVIVDKGYRQHLYVGQPVLDAYGVMGQVVHVGHDTSKVMLATDPKNAIPVQDYRNGIRAIAIGDGVDKLNLINVPKTSDIRSGDLFIASGLGLRFPVGYPVGRVDQVIKQAGQRFSKISLQPSAHLDQTQQVLLAWPSQLSLAKAVKRELQAKLPQPAGDS